MKDPSSFDDKVKKIAHSLGSKGRDEMVLRVLLPSKSYGAEIVQTINKKSSHHISEDALIGGIYEILASLLSHRLIEYSGSIPGGKRRNHHRTAYYQITELGREVIHYLNVYRLSLSEERTFPEVEGCTLPEPKEHSLPDPKERSLPDAGNPATI